jgi:glucan phosphoethanolaminetransferase (alkaline phosphatase superfamily)
MNNTFGLGGASRVIKADRCLFKLAKNNGFKTFFYSAQSSQQLRYIINSLCPKYIDDYKSFIDITKETQDENAVNDHDLLDQVEKIDLTQGRNFIVLHHRGSHSPIGLRFNKESHIFKNSAQDIGKASVINNYDNSTFHLDLFFKKLFEKIKDKKKTIVLYASDHGEGVGQDNIWGHGMLKKISMDIPVIGYSQNKDFKIKLDQLGEIPTHLNLTLLLSNLLGYKTSIPFNSRVNYRVLGNDLNGFAGWADIIPKEDNYVLKVHHY